jgi:glycosyltransferase involved in cell wall biosynthesis
MPAYNAEKYIGEAIESILNQTYKNFEFIIVDDASTDNTWRIIQKYAKKDKRIIIDKNKTNLYIAHNRNKLVKMALGKYIAWQDADDISVKDRLQKQVEFMDSHPEVGIVGGHLKFFDEKGSTSIRKYALDDQSLRKTIFRYSPVAQPTAMIRKECFKKVALYNPKYPPAEDIDMSFRIGRYWQFANLQQVTLLYREHFISATFKRLKKIEFSTLEVRYANANKFGYRMSFFDKFFNLLQYMSIYVIPPYTRIKMFNFFRNTR